MNRRTWLAYLAAMAVALPVKAAPMREGRVVAVDIKDLMVGKKLKHRYLCTFSDGDLNYVVEFEKPLRLAVNDPVKFEIKKDSVTIVDADGKKRSSQIEKRERVAAGDAKR